MAKTATEQKPAPKQDRPAQDRPGRTDQPTGKEQPADKPAESKAALGERLKNWYR